MPVEAAHLRQEARRRAILSEGSGEPGIGRVIAAEHPRRPAQIPVRGDQQRHWCWQAHAAAVGRKGDLCESRDGQVARSFVLDQVDSESAAAVEALGYRVLVTDTVMDGEDGARRLARTLLDFALPAL